ncbi:MAG: hypothetical protein OEV55_05865 [candidate division Zixibacteria bacterium]|nr:hypothetical protein [candidate division Zixibacteria bacterium]
MQNHKSGLIPGRFSRMLLIVLLAGVVLSASCPQPVPRPLPAFEGSAKWALNIAQPLIASFASDAQLYNILGAVIYKDGRLPSNTGDWSFVVWSASQQKQFQVTVKFDGTASTSTRSVTTPPSPSRQPIPNGWINSTEIFAALAPHLVSGVTHAQLVTLNLVNYPQAPNQAVWGISFNQGPNQLIMWDGTYLGHQ